MNSMNTFEALWQDVRYGWRMLWKNPGITAVALLSLALGIGATTCIFSVIYGVLISPYPYVKANEIWAPEIRNSKNPKNSRGVFLPYEFKELEKLPGVSMAMGTRPEEALLTARLMGNRVEHLYDVGVAGIHRLLKHSEELMKARVIICVAGMEGALPSVVGGLVAVPVIAVPTSVGYGASFGGVAALPRDGAALGREIRHDRIGGLVVV